MTALVVARPGATPDVDALRQLVRDRKGAVYAPKTVEVVDSTATHPRRQGGQEGVAGAATGAIGAAASTDGARRAQARQGEVHDAAVEPRQRPPTWPGTPTGCRRRRRRATASARSPRPARRTAGRARRRCCPVRARPARPDARLSTTTSPSAITANCSGRRAALDQHGVGGQPHGGQQRPDPRQLVSAAPGEQRQVGDVRDEDQPTPLHGPGLSTALRNQPF